jgi:hypothetical protein
MGSFQKKRFKKALACLLLTLSLSTLTPLLTFADSHLTDEEALAEEQAAAWEGTPVTDEEQAAAWEGGESAWEGGADTSELTEDQEAAIAAGLAANDVTDQTYAEEKYWCYQDMHNIQYLTNGDNQKEYEQFLGSWEQELINGNGDDEDGAYKSDNCSIDGTGQVKENSTTGYVEKGDCSKAGLVITEISETLNASPGEIDGNFVSTVYKGLCCFIPEVDEDGNYVGCKDTRSIYTETFSDCKESAAFCEKRQWIVASSGVGIIKTFVKLIFIWGAGVGGFIAVIVIVISGIQITLSGVSGDISSSKQRILQSLSGLVLIFLSGLLLYAVNPTFFT